ncbi:uncharacterized protein ARMOST_18866 [Armillaria ostoyae]|uniref:Uncharacterized protein n=1 Tax=Armillaria ostoyae TaxID=47428 RepID=A0A284S2X8_ARMOS|nr:uncharacterized protein ARMOST_18866 [Armillaria ostoyae]
MLMYMQLEGESWYCSDSSNNVQDAFDSPELALIAAVSTLALTCSHRLPCTSPEMLRVPLSRLGGLPRYVQVQVAHHVFNTTIHCLQRTIFAMNRICPTLAVFNESRKVYLGPSVRFGCCP